MSCSYADGLSPYEHKGKLGQVEIFDAEDIVAIKSKELADLIGNSKHVVVHTGAGISTSAGIPDFRGPNGVWTLEQKGQKPSLNISFDDAIPTKTHMALLKLIEAGKIHYIISQNIDGLHLKSGLKRKYLAELHGNMFVEECSSCKRQFVLKSATRSVGKKCLERPCLSTKVNARRCRGKTYDTILDWEHSLPDKDLEMADYHSSVADLSICLGTTLQIVPSGNLPLSCKKQNGKLVICNLQPTKHDKKADLIIHTYVDQILERVLNHFDLKIPEYDPEIDPTKWEAITEWTISSKQVAQMKQVYKSQNIKRKNEKDSIKRKKSKADVNQEEIESEDPKSNGTQNEIKSEDIKEEDSPPVSINDDCDSKADVTGNQTDVKQEEIKTEDPKSNGTQNELKEESEDKEEDSPPVPTNDDCDSKVNVAGNFNQTAVGIN